MRIVKPIPSRRRFLSRGAALAGAGALLAQPALLSAAPSSLDAARFAACLSDTFRAWALSHPGAAPLSLQLVEVAPLPGAAASSVGAPSPQQSLIAGVHTRQQPLSMGADSRQLSFFLVFSLAGDPAVQDTYALQHPAIGHFAALLVPDRDPRRLTATFNRLA